MMDQQHWWKLLVSDKPGQIHIKHKSKYLKTEVRYATAGKTNLYNFKSKRVSFITIFSFHIPFKRYISKTGWKHGTVHAAIRDHTRPTPHDKHENLPFTNSIMMATFFFNSHIVPFLQSSSEEVSFFSSLSDVFLRLAFLCCFFFFFVSCCTSFLLKF